MATLKPRTGTRLSIEEFMELPDTFDKRKMELDEGELYIMPRPRTGHQFLQLRVVGYVDSTWTNPTIPQPKSCTMSSLLCRWKAASSSRQTS